MVERSGPETKKQACVHLLVLGLLCAVVFFFRLGDRPLWDVDEGMHAATSKDMVLTGDWVTPRVNGENFYDKTAFFNWLAALSFLGLGFTEFAARLPAAVLGLATVLVTYAAGRRLSSPSAGLLAGVIVATSPEFIILSRSVVHDISLAFFITTALFFFYAAYDGELHRRRNLLLFYVSAGFAVLAKGPIGLLLPAMIIGLFLLLRGRLCFLKEMGLSWGMPVFLIVAAPWYVLISMRNADYVSYFFLKQNLGNFLSKKVTHPQPFYYYIPVLLGGMLPWSFFLPLAMYRPLKKGIRQVDDGVLFLICWFSVIFLFFTAASSKLDTYLLPAFPAVALLVAGIWRELMESPEPGLRRGTASSFVPLVILFFAGMLIILVIQPPMKKLQLQYGIKLRDLLGFWLTITGIPVIAFLFFFFRRYRAAFTALATTFVAGILIFILAYAPAMDPYRSTKVLAQEMDAILPAGEQLIFFKKLGDTSLFYTNRRALVIHSEEQLLDYLSSNKRVLCVIERVEFERHEKVVRASHILREEGNKLLISNRPLS